VEEQKTTKHPEESQPRSIAEALNPGMESMSRLVAKYTAAALAAQKAANGSVKSEIEHPCPNTER
jgi:hypothetical protein